MDVGITHEAYARPFTSGEAAEWLSISKRQLLELMRCGIIPAVKVGQRWRSEGGGSESRSETK